MGTLASELLPIAELADTPRIYADANLPAGLIQQLRTRLKWDVLFVVEHDDLRRARDVEHFKSALECGRTLITLDHDFLDDRLFPLADSPGVVVLSAPNEKGLFKLLTRLDRWLFRHEPAEGLPLRGRKMTLTPDTDLPDA